MILLLLLSAAGLLPCSYRASGQAEIAPHGPCATRTKDGSLRIDRRHLVRLNYGSDGLAEVFAEGVGWAYVRRGGETLEVLTEDNGPDEFADGLVRIRRGGKIGYADRSFRIAIAPQFDFGWPFAKGRALVCRGCRVELSKLSEEHAAVSGGLWGYIDRTGREVVPVTLSREEALAKRAR